MLVSKLLKTKNITDTTSLVQVLRRSRPESSVVLLFVSFLFSFVFVLFLAKTRVDRQFDLGVLKSPSTNERKIDHARFLGK